MNEDTRKLLQECEAGCKMATESMHQVTQYVQDDKLLEIIESYKQKHKQLEEKISELLQESGKDEKAPGAMASAFSWFSTEMKLMMKDDSHQIAKIMMDGCNMGIQSVCEYQNKYDNAEKHALHIAQELVKIEEEFMSEMKQFL